MVKVFSLRKQRGVFLDGRPLLGSYFISTISFDDQRFSPVTKTGFHKVKVLSLRKQRGVFLDGRPILGSYCISTISFDG